MKVRLFAAFLLVSIDQLSKLVFRKFSVLNQGGVFGIAQGYWWELLLLPAIVYLTYMWIRETNKTQVIGLTLLVAGGVGNIVDRLMRGGVIDFIHYPLLGLRGNIADIYLALAVTVIFYQAIKTANDSTKHE